MTEYTGEYPMGDWAGPSSELDRADDLAAQIKHWEILQDNKANDSIAEGEQ